MGIKKSKRKIENPTVCCNNCGELVDRSFCSVIDNGYFCHNCFPVLKKDKKKKEPIPNEKNMLLKILNKNGKN